MALIAGVSNCFSPAFLVYYRIELTYREVSYRASLFFYLHNMSQDLGTLQYDLTIDEKNLDKTIKSIDSKLKSKNKDWEKYLSVDFSQATKGAISYQKILREQEQTEKQRFIAAQQRASAASRAEASAARTAEVARKSAANALADEQRLAAAKARTAKAQLTLAQAQKRAARQVDKTSSAYKKQSLYLQNLNTLAASYASIFAVARIADKIREVTGEFELQNKALGAILQNKEKADQLFGQVADLALKSPFAIKELLTYTKQLAAYRIETESLIPTLKQLADVSAGLGVDMSRLILAYGQVRAASVLRGTELRQFTEAGIPLVQLLADKFSILEGRVVSTNEVFDKISNRMVSFAMVSEVFEEMTQKGGLFFEAQAVQAKTLAGMWNILGDAIDKAMFQIGTENMDLLKGAVQGATDLTRSWEAILTTLKALIIGYGAWRTAQILINASRARNLILIKSEATSLGALTFAQRRANLEQLKSISILHRLKTALRGIKGAIGGLAVGALFAIGSALYDAYLEANRFNKELDEISNTEAIRGGKLVSEFREMADAAKNAADGSKDQRDALSALNRVYKDYLPNQILTIDGLRKLEGGYDSVTEAINRKVEAQAREKGLAAIESEFKAREAERTEALVQSLVGDDKLSEEAARAFVNNFKKSFEDAVKKGDTFQVYREFNEQLEEFLGKDITGKFSKDFAKGMGAASANANALIGVLDDVSDAHKRLDDQLAGKFKIPTGQYAEEIDALKRFKGEYNATVEKIEATGDLTDAQVDENKLEAQKDQLRDTVKLYEDLASKAKAAGDQTGKIEYFSKKMEEAQLALSRLVVTQDAYRQSIDDIIKAEGTEKGFGRIFRVTEQEDIIKHQKRIADSYSKIKDEISVTEKALTRLNKEEKDTAAIKSKLERLRIERAIAKAIIDAYGIKLKSGKVDDTELNNLKAQAKLLTDIKKAREDLAKTLSKEKVEESIQKLFGIQAEDLGIDIPITSDTSAFYDQLREVAERAKELGTEAGEALSKAINSQIAKFQVKDLTNAAKKALKALDEEIKTFKGKYDFYKDVLGITGDEEIALKFGIDKKSFTEVLKKATVEAAKIRGFDITFEELKERFDELPPEIQKRVLAVDNAVEESTKNAILDKLKFLEQDIPEGIGLEFDFSNVIKNIESKVKELKREVAKAVVEADTGEVERINELKALRLKAINEESRQRAEKIGGTYVKEQLEIKQLGAAYSNMTDASLKDVEKILAVIKESKDDLLSKGGIASILRRADISKTAETAFFSGLSDSENIDEFLLKLNEIEAEVSNIDELRIGDEVIDEKQLGKIRAAVEVFQAMGIALVNAGESAEKIKLDKQIAQWKKFSDELLGVIDSISGIGDAFSEDLSDSSKKAIEGLKGAASGAIEAVSETSRLASIKVAETMSAIEKASAILAIISAAMQIASGIRNIIEAGADADAERQAAAVKLAADRLEVERRINERLIERNDIQEKNILLSNNFAKDMTRAFEDFYNETDRFNKALEELGEQGLFTGTGSARNIWGKTTREFNAGINDLLKGLKEGTSSFRKALNVFSNTIGLDILGLGRGSRASERAVKDLENKFNQALSAMGKTASDVANFTNEDWLFFYETMEDIGAITDEGTRKFLEMAKASAEAMKEAQESMDSFITNLAGGLENDLAQALRNGFEQGIDAAEAFRTSVENIMEELVLQGIINTLFDDAFADLASNIKASFDPESGTADRSIIDDLEKFYNATGGLYEDAIGAIEEAREDAAKRGFDLFGTDGGELGALAKGIQGVTEDTARRLEALLNSIREVTIGDSSKMSEIVEAIGNQSIIASQSIAHLQNIDNNVLAFKTAFDSVLTNAQNTGGTGIKVYMQ